MRSHQLSLHRLHQIEKYLAQNIKKKIYSILVKGNLIGGGICQEIKKIEFCKKSQNSKITFSFESGILMGIF